MKYPVVEVLWADSHTGINEWTPLSEVRAIAVEKHALRMRSVGFLITNDPDYLILAASFSDPTSADEELANLTIQIPRACVSDVKYLTVADDRAPL